MRDWTHQVQTQGAYQSHQRKLPPQRNLIKGHKIIKEPKFILPSDVVLCHCIPGYTEINSGSRLWWSRKWHRLCPSCLEHRLHLPPPDSSADLWGLLLFLLSGVAGYHCLSPTLHEQGAVEEEHGRLGKRTSEERHCLLETHTFMVSHLSLTSLFSRRKKNII